MFFRAYIRGLCLLFLRKNPGLMSMEGSLASPGDGSRHTNSPPRHRRRRSRSRSRSRSQKRRRHRSRSRSRQRHRDRDREKDKERDAEIAKEKERRKKGLPPIKKNHLSGELCFEVRYIRVFYADFLLNLGGKFVICVNDIMCFLF